MRPLFGSPGWIGSIKFGFSLLDLLLDGSSSAMGGNVPGMLA